MGDNGEIKEKVEKVEEKMDTLQKEVTGFIGQLSKASRETLVVTPAEKQVETASAIATVTQAGPSVNLRCIQWADFIGLAAGAQTVSFNFKEENKVFQATALKGNQVITYSGVLPKLSSVIKMWLSKQLNVPERCILEGTLAVG